MNKPLTVPEPPLKSPYNDEYGNFHKNPSIKDYWKLWVYNDLKQSEDA